MCKKSETKRSDMNKVDNSPIINSAKWKTGEIALAKIVVCLKHSASLLFRCEYIHNWRKEIPSSEGRNARWHYYFTLPTSIWCINLIPLFIFTFNLFLLFISHLYSYYTYSFYIFHAFIFSLYIYSIYSSLYIYIIALHFMYV